MLKHIADLNFFSTRIYQSEVCEIWTAFFNDTVKKLVNDISSSVIFDCFSAIELEPGQVRAFVCKNLKNVVRQVLDLVIITKADPKLL